MCRWIVQAACVLSVGWMSLLGRPAAAQEQPAATNDPIKVAADAAYRSGNFEEAERLLNEALTRNAKDDVALYLRASARVERGAEEGNADLVRSGIADARAAIAIKTQIDYYLPYLYGMSRLAEIEKRPEHGRSGLDVANKVLSSPQIGGSEMQKANIHYQKGLLNVAVGDIPSAKAEFGAAITGNPGHLAAHSALCDLVARTGTPQEAETQYDKTIAQLKDQPLLYNNRGTFLQSLGRHDDALKDFSKAVQIDPRYVPAWTNRGFAQLMLGRDAEAEADLNKSLELDPQQPTAYGLRGTARLQQGRADTAIQDYQTAVSLDPTNPAAYYDLGFAQFFDRNYAEARDAFNQALKVDPTIPFLSPWRYASMVFSGQREQAVAEFGSIESKPEAERTWFDIMTLYLMGKINEDAVLVGISNQTPNVKLAQECEANYFFGLRTASRNQTEPSQAKQFFEKAIGTNARHLSAYRGARYALSKFQ